MNKIALCWQIIVSITRSSIRPPVNEICHGSCRSTNIHTASNQQNQLRVGLYYFGYGASHSVSVYCKRLHGVSRFFGTGQLHRGCREKAFLRCCSLSLIYGRTAEIACKSYGGILKRVQQSITSLLDERNKMTQNEPMRYKLYFAAPTHFER